MKTGMLLNVAGAAVLFAATADAQNFPNKPILIVLPQQAGSASDVMVRIVTQKMSENMKQQFVLVNMAGAGGLIGAERLANAVADGYTLGSLNDGLLTQVPYLFPKIPYDPFKDFEPVAMVAKVAYVLVASPALLAKSVAELVALAKAQPGKIDFASGGNGNAQHLAMELFKSATATSLTHVPFRGAAQAGLEVVSGRVPLMFSGIAPVLSFIRDGRLRALGVPAEKRSSLLPDAPTVSEAGVPGFVFFTYTSFFAPRATPKAVIQILNAETNKALADVNVRERLLQIGLEPSAFSPDELGRLIRADSIKMAKIIKDAGIKAE
jgi:tripartite-type tricarboxylate transporter receptor subunit TctC